MNIQQMQSAIWEAEEIVKNAEKSTSTMCSIITPRLQLLPSWQLKDLKKRLAKYNTRTQEWK